MPSRYLYQHRVGTHSSFNGGVLSVALHEDVGGTVDVEISDDGAHARVGPGLSSFRRPERHQNFWDAVRETVLHRNFPWMR